MKTDAELTSGKINNRNIRQINTSPERANYPSVYKAFEVQRICTNKKTGEIRSGSRIYLSSDPDLKSATALRYIRTRWNVENKNHYPRDYTLMEDKCRCRTGNTAANLALLRGIVIHFWKKEAPQIPLKRFCKNNLTNIDSRISKINHL